MAIRNKSWDTYKLSPKLVNCPRTQVPSSTNNNNINNNNNNNNTKVWEDSLKFKETGKKAKK